MQVPEVFCQGKLKRMNPFADPWSKLKEKAFRYCTYQKCLSEAPAFNRHSHSPRVWAMTESPSENMASSIDFSSIPQLTFDDGAAVRSKPNESLGGGLLVGYRTISSAHKIISSCSENIGVSAQLKPDLAKTSI